MRNHGVIGDIEQREKTVYVEDKQKMLEFEQRLEAEKEEFRKKSEKERLQIEKDANLKQEEKERLI